MPPNTKKSKKDQKSKGPPEKVYDLLTADDMKAREQKYTNRLNDLRICLNFIDDAIVQVEHLNEIQLIADKWLDFISCNPLPKPYIPPDIRVFFTKLKHFEEESSDANIDWPLAVVERSILSQNIFRKDLTRMQLVGKLKPEFGIEYNQNVNDCLNVIRRIEYFLDNDMEVAKCSYSILADIKEQKFAVQDEIPEFFNRYTYRILCSEDAYMNSIDAISTEYNYTADNFQMHIWSLKNVPISFAHLDEPRLVANFHEIKLRLHIPSTMLRENLSIRAIRMNFDHISEKAKSFSQLITVPVDNLNAGIQDLHECLINEWLMQLDMQNRKREEMVQERLDYEDKLREYEEEQAKKGKKKAEDKDAKPAKKPKIVKPSKEPPQIDPDVFPDIYVDFLEEEQKQYANFINQIYNPDSLGLDCDEINLKRFFILGGIYQLYYVEKPEHSDFDFDRFNMTWHHNDSKLMVHRDIFIPSTPRYLSRRSTRLMSHMNLQRLSRAKGAEPPKDSTDPECPWFVLTITLPEYLCLWGEPIACHYETITKRIEEKAAEEPEPVQETHKKTKGERKIASSVSLPTIQASDGGEKELQSSKDSEYFPYLTPYAEEKHSSIFKLRRLTASQRLSHGNFFRSSLSLRISHADLARQARSSDGTLNIEDFPLTNLLNISEIRHLARHCLPRIISSFKFPKEIREEDLEAYRNRPKGKGGTLLRKQADISDNVKDKSVNRVFTFNDKQNNPERLFAIYPPEELMRIISYFQDEDTTDNHLEPESFLELIKILNSIKTKYRLRIRRTLDLKAFKSKLKFENQRFKQQHKKSERKALQTSFSEEKSVGQSKSIMQLGSDKKPMKKEKQDLLRAGSKVGIVEPSEDDMQDVSTYKVSTQSQCKKEEFAGTDPATITYSHWTTRHIISSEYDKEKHTFVIQTDRLGYIGFAFKRYEHFPFKYWSLEPSETDPDNEVVFTLDTQYVRCVLYCTPNGIRGHVTEPSKKFIRNPKMYLIIDKPMKDYKAFKKMFKDNYLNIFAEHDACYYIENGYFSEKHLATEMHTYCCMSVHSTQMKFNFSQWNRLAKRRDLIFKYVQFKDLPENTVEVRITPEEAFFVEITELCSDDLDVIKLQYTPTWRNIGTYTDLHHLINSMYPAATDMRCKNPKLISCIRDLLNEIRPLSFS